jgi:hypothetical protein
MSLTAFMVCVAMARARREPSASTASIWASSSTRRRISPAMGASLVTATSTRAALKPENCEPPCWRSTSSGVESVSAA